MLMALCLSVAGGIGLGLLLPLARVRRTLTVAAVMAAIAADGAIDPVGVSTPPGRIDLPRVPAAAVLELPPDSVPVSIGAMHRSISHGLPLINGYSGYIPPHYDILSQSLRRDDPSAVLELARGRTLLILIAEQNDPAGYFRRLIERIPGVTRQHATSAGILHVLPAQPRDRRPPGGVPYTFSSMALPRSHFVLDLGSPRVVRTLEFPLRNRFSDLDSRIAIETSDDQRDWKTVWEDWTAGAALAGALEDPRRIPVRLILPDVRARYLRIHPARDWLIDELSVLGP
jgi:hypothetical protein